MMRATRAVVALIVLAGLIVAIPVLLIAIVGNPWPAGGLSQVEMMSDTVILGVIAVLGWVFWAQVTLCALWELPAALRGLDATRIPIATSGQQQLVRILLHSILAIGVTTTVVGSGLTHRADAQATSNPAHAARLADRPGLAPTVAADVRHGEPRVRPGRASTGPVAAASAKSAHGERPAPVVTVSRGDTLWGLAEAHLGDGQRWREIAALNRGHDMGAGLIFSSGRSIEPGWRLILPADASTSPDDTAPAPNHSSQDPDSIVVQPGDTLSGVAEDELGNAAMWPRLYEENRRVVGPDPDLILPGQVLNLGRSSRRGDRFDDERGDPDRNQGAQSATPVPPAEGTEPGTRPPQEPPTVGADGAAGPGTGSSTRPSGGAPTEPTPPQSEPSTTSPGDSPDHRGGVTALRALLASAVCLASGALGLLLVNRRRQFRERRPGRAVPATPVELGPVERAVVETGSEAQPDVEFLDRALRHVAASRRLVGSPLPSLEAAVLAPEYLRLQFSTPAAGETPEGWDATDDATAWTLPRSTILEADLMAQPAPYPALVSVGHDRQGRTWMLDLEAVGVLGVSGPPEQVADLARFLVAELAVNAWSEGSEVLLTDGFAAETIALNPSRLRPCDVAASIRRAKVAAADADDSARNLGRDLLDLRRDGENIDSTVPLVIVSPASDVTELAGQVGHGPRSRVVVVDTNRTPVIELTGDGMAYLRLLGISVTPYLLPAEQAAAMAALMDATSSPQDTKMPDAGHGAAVNEFADAAGAIRAEFTTPRQSEGEDSTSLLPHDDDDYLDAGATTVDDLSALAPTVPEQTRTRVEAVVSTLDQDLADWNDANSERPKVHVLGPVDVTALRGDRTGIANLGGTIEFIIYLASQERGATKDRAADALGWSGATVHNRARDARRFLGTRSDGQDWLPDAAKSESARLRGVAAYQLHPDVLVDADLFRNLRTRGQARGSAGLDDLRSALALVNGQPFDQLRRGGYGWLSQDRLDHHMCAAIGDVAHVLVTHFLAAGDPVRARSAAQIAITAVPHSEVAHLDLAAITDATGTASVDDVIREQVLDRVDADPTVRTEEIIEQKGWMAS